MIPPYISFLLLGNVRTQLFYEVHLLRTAIIDKQPSLGRKSVQIKHSITLIKEEKRKGPQFNKTNLYLSYIIITFARFRIQKKKNWNRFDLIGGEICFFATDSFLKANELKTFQSCPKDNLI